MGTDLILTGINDYQNKIITHIILYSLPIAKLKPAIGFRIQDSDGHRRIQKEQQ